MGVAGMDPDVEPALFVHVFECRRYQGLRPPGPPNVLGRLCRHFADHLDALPIAVQRFGRFISVRGSRER